MRLLLILSFISLPSVSFAQTFSFSGNVLDEKGDNISYATIAILDQKDSTLVYYAVTNTSGGFEIKNIVGGTYILQSAFLGYKTFYREVAFPSEKTGQPFTIIMQAKPVSLPAAEVNAERIPLLIRGDTIEYDAAAYKTKPDAVAEDLLKKLPGVSVDRNGKIKAQGEEVKKVTVDGKEFFGNDPKVATRNLPADAINKVQVFDTKSDQAELTGINDGKRDKTINLELKDDKKSAWFGDVQAGAGTKDHYQSSAKAYRFTPERQIAFLGMLNNINKFGFSFSDYINFNGGFGNGNSLKITNDNSFPIDFGGVENGLIASAGLGANYSVESRKDNRYNISYLANGMNKKLNQQEATTNFTGYDQFNSNQNSDKDIKNRAHRLNFGWKNRIDTTHTFNLSGQASLNDNNESNSASLFNSYDGTVISDQHGGNGTSGNSFNTSIHSGFLNKMYSNWKLLSVEADASWQHILSQNEINTLTNYYSPPEEYLLNQFQNKENDLVKYSAGVSALRKIGEQSYLEGNLSAGNEHEMFSRQQGLAPQSDGIIDSLSGKLNKNYQWVQPGIKFKRANDKTNLTLSVATQFVDMTNNMDNQSDVNFRKIYFLPMANWEKEYSASRRIRLFYETSIVTPQASEFYPITNYFDPLNRINGNQNLKPEVHNDLRLHWSVFDQFSFTSIFAGLRFSYIKDKINWTKTIDENLVQSNALINVPDDYQAGVNAEYSTPIRKLGVNINLTVDEGWDRTFVYVNGLLNRNSSLTSDFGISFDNRKKGKWEISTGVNMRYVRSLYTLPTVPKQSYVKGNAFADLGFNPSDNWQFSVKADLSHYYGQSFQDNVYVPLLQADVSYLFLKNKRGMLTLSGFDLLNRNTGVDRSSEYNYVRETKSDIIQRYVMLSFKYKLNKFTSGNNIDVKVNGR